MKAPPADGPLCPFRCDCHARCTGVATEEIEGWATLHVDASGEKRSFHALTPVVSTPNCLDCFEDMEIVAIQYGEVANMTRERVAGKVVLVGLGDGEVSKEAAVNYAHAAGAIAVIAYNERIADMFPLMERQLFAVSPVMVMIRQDDGRWLAQQAKKGVALRCSSIKDLSVEEEKACRRRQQQKQRIPEASVWLHMSGFELQPVTGSMMLWDITGGNDLREFTPETLWGHWVRRREEWLPRVKLARILGCGVDKVASFVPNSRASQLLGYTTMMSMNAGNHELAWLRFEPCDQHSGRVGVYGELRPTATPDSKPSRQIGEVPGPNGQKHRLTQADVVRALKYFQAKVIAGPNFLRFGTRLVPSYATFAYCFSGEACRLPPADAAKFIKLFTACRGPVAQRCRESWQQGDRTWNITDTRNWRGELQEQGRMLWEGRAELEIEKAKARAASEADHWLDAFLASVLPSAMACGCLSRGSD
eukprot:TRINITY_DN10370_c0_g1_i2.p1 TRINITY_DN10370_c0_g1~~TRINITY_DN10370_c0_g1_i2.p1  ORF type:complete len:477 (+),score=80.46 TRINITY_DN10370_c0_g1_i2:297-1727(+)